MEPFQELNRFLEKFAPEVGGRSTDAITPDLAERITAFRAGELGTEEARELSRELLANRNALDHLASLLKN